MSFGRALPVPFLVLSAACATGARPGAGEGVHTSSVAAAHPHRLGDLSRFALPYRLVEAKTGTVLSAEQALADLASVPAVFFAEQHGNPHHHAAQLQLIAALFARDPSLAIGLEMVKRPFQPAVDAFLKGDIDEDRLTKDVEWDDRWGYDFELYAPIFEFARAHGLAMVALNAPDEVTRAVARGGVESLPDDERRALPDLDLGNAAHRAMIREIFDAHHGHAAGSFDAFYTAQVIWDETMAYELARALKADHAPKRVVVLAGDGHVRYGLGIPERAARRGAAPFRTVHPVMVDELEDELSDVPGDYLWVMATEEEELPAVGKIE